jgi:RND superfamily putative drug exporter
MTAVTTSADHAKPARRSVFERWGRTAYRRRRRILLIALLVAVVGGVWGTTIFAKVQTAGGFDAPNSQSQHEAALATKAFGRDAGDVVVLYSSKTLTTASPAFRSAVTHALAALPHSKVESYATYWSTGSRQFVSATGHQTYAVLELAGATDTARQTSYDAIKTGLSAPGLRSQVGGAVPTDETIDQQTTRSITRAEGLSFPILLILLLVIFGGLTAACLPLAIGALGILGSFTALRLLTIITGVSVFSLNITTILGLGLGIDYGLFLVTRFREELRKRGSVEDAVARTVATAGRTVLVSGVTVAIVLASLMLFPETILRSIGYGGVATVLLDMLAALTVLPALLAVLGPKVNSLLAGREGRPAGPRERQRGGLRGVVPPGRHRQRRLVPARAQRDAPPRPVRNPDRGTAARPRIPVPEGRLGRRRCHRAAVRRCAADRHRGAEPRLPRQPHRPDRGHRPVHRPHRRITGPQRRPGRLRHPPGPRPRHQQRTGDRHWRRHCAG